MANLQEIRDDDLQRIRSSGSDIPNAVAAVAPRAMVATGGPTDGSIEVLPSAVPVVDLVAEHSSEAAVVAGETADEDTDVMQALTWMTGMKDHAFLTALREQVPSGVVDEALL